jgi:ATP-dependent RNA helicase DeaD
MSDTVLVTPTTSAQVPANPIIPTPPAANGFATLGLSEKLVASVAALGYSDPTPIQREAIPVILTGADLIGLAATGTGKTAAFTLPIVDKVAAQAKPRKQPSALVLVPTRELAIQVATAIAKYGKPLGVGVTAVYGGAGFGDQARSIRNGTDVVVATPGRALDHIRKGTMALDHVAHVVLDEADEMLDMGFADDLDAILSATPKARQTMLFSATMPPRIVVMAEKHQKQPKRIEIAKAVAAPGEAPKVRQTAYFVHRDHKFPAVARLIDFENPSAAIVFCRTRHEADSLADTLNERGYKPESLHGGLSQEQRDRVMKKFRNGSVNLLIATDVAARGLDIHHLSHVINFSVPESPETYVHRIGRVGRAGREGVAITMVEPREQFALRGIERAAKARIDIQTIPTVAQLQAKRLERTRDEVRETVEAGDLDEYKAVLEPLFGQFSIVDLALAAVKLAHTAGKPDDGAEEIPVPQMRDSRPARDNSFGAPRNDRRPGPGGPGGTGGYGGGPRAAARGMARIFITAGRDVGVTRRDIVAAIENEVGINSRDIGPIDIAERFTLVDVPAEVTDYAVESLNGIRFRGRKVSVRRDRALNGVE